MINTRETRTISSAFARAGISITEDEYKQVSLVSKIASVFIIPFYLILVLIFCVPEPFLQIVSNSMYPKYKTGDIILTCSPHWFGTRIKEGTVIIYRPNGRSNVNTIIHRVIGKTEQGWITKGDANPLPDQDRKVKPRIRPVTDEQIIGKVLFKIPMSKKMKSASVDAKNGNVDGLKKTLKEMEFDK